MRRKSAGVLVGLMVVLLLMPVASASALADSAVTKVRAKRAQATVVNSGPLVRGMVTPGFSTAGLIASFGEFGYLDANSEFGWLGSYTIALTAGETFRATLTGDAGTSFDLVMYEPGADPEFDEPIAWTESITYPETLTHTASKTGVYIFEVWALDGAGKYNVDYTVNAATPVVRVAGTTRYDVATALARKGWDPNGDKFWHAVRHVIVACGDNGKEADPLAAAGLAGLYDCPVLLTGVTSLPASTKTALTEIAAANPEVQIHLIGGVNSVPDARWDTIKAIPGVNQTKDRISGQSRYDVSSAIAGRMVDGLGAQNLGGVLIVAGDNLNGFYDALAASPIAYANAMPILSVQKDSVPFSVNYLLTGTLANVPRHVVNSSTYVSDATKTKVKAQSARLTTSSNRYTAASQIAVASINNGWLTPESTAMAAKLPDALTGGVFSGLNGGVMLFTDSTSVIQPATKSFITGRRLGIYDGWVFGGTNSVPAAQETSFRNALK